jgi:hypothetical protein
MVSGSLVLDLVLLVHVLMDLLLRRLLMDGFIMMGHLPCEECTGWDVVGQVMVVCPFLCVFGRGRSDTMVILAEHCLGGIFQYGGLVRFFPA